MAGSREAEAQNLVADREFGDPGPGRRHDTGEVAALTGGKGGGEHLMHRPPPDAGLAGVDSGGTNLDHHLALAGCRHFDISHVQHVTAPVTVEPYGARHCSRHLDLLTARIEPVSPSPSPA